MEGMREWAEVPLWDACFGTLTVWNPISKEIVWFNPDWTPRARARLDLPSVPLDHKDIERYLEAMARHELGPEYSTQGIDFSLMARQHRSRFATHQPLATDLRCQGPNLAWLRLFSTSSDPLGRGSNWIAMDDGGAVHHMSAPGRGHPSALSPQMGFGGPPNSPGASK